jgi:uncharacterized lipoprotein YddW (UPF0748 family)
MAVLKYQKIYSWIAIVICPFVLFCFSQGKALEQPEEKLIIGVKIYDYTGSFPELFEEWRSLGINTAFVSASLESNQEFRSLAKKNGIAIFIIIPIFYNPEELEKRPDLFAVTDAGKKASEEWVNFVCPSRKDYRSQRIEYVKKLVREFNPEGISLDFIRYFVYWEKVYPARTLSSLPNTCFDSHCLEEFQKETKIKIPQELTDTSEKARWIIENHLQQWTEWKCRVVTSMVKALSKEAKKIKPGIKINVHTVPWRSNDFGGAIKIIAGQDLAKIAPCTDYLSPMCYHHMVMRNTSWIQSVVEDVYNLTHSQVIPSIQVKEAYIDKTLTLPEFRDSLVEALKPPSKGVVFWSWENLENSADKKEIIKAVLKSRTSGPESFLSPEL